MSQKSQNPLTVFAETNFLFDCAFERDVNAEYLLSLARQKSIQLNIPRFAFAEAEGQSEVIIQRRIENLQLTLSNLRELRRSRHREEEMGQLIGSITALVHQLESEINERKTAIERIEPSCYVIPYNMEIQARARLRAIARNPPFAENDCVIYESILWFAEQNQDLNLAMLFLTRNRRDFDYPTIHQELGEFGIGLFFEPGECVRRVRQLLDPAQET